MTSPESQNSKPVTEAEMMNNEINNIQNNESAGAAEESKTPESSAAVKASEAPKTSAKTGITMASLMIEDFRHRKWMLVLSSIVQFFFGPFFVLFILSRYEPRYNYDMNYLKMATQIRDSVDTMCGYLAVLAVVVAAVGALIVGFGGFRHLFNKRMTDMMNSVPVKRGKMFAVIYLNGFLMWLVPFLVFGGITIIEIAVKLGKYGVMAQVFGYFFSTLIGAAFAFFCVYNLVVLCTAISGTIFNAIVNFICLGFEASAIWLIFLNLSEAYFRNFWRSAVDYMDVSWISAPISGCTFGFLISARMGLMEICSSPLSLACLILTAALCIFNIIIGYRLYIDRNSEEAENGTSGKVYKFVLRFATSILAGLYTSYMVSQIVGFTRGYGWSIFIAVCFSALAFGVMDIIQKKSFRAFFAHRAQMALSVAVTLLILAVFILDVINFDNHIVPANNIASASVRMSIDNYYWWDTGTGYVPVEGKPGCITWNELASGNEYSDEVEISAELAEEIMRSEKVYYRNRFSDYDTEAYTYDPVTGRDGILPEEYRYDHAYVYLSVDRNTGLDFLRSYRIADKELLEKISKTEGYKETNYPLNCGAFGYPMAVKITDDYENAICTLTGDEVQELMSVYFEEFNKNYELYGVNSLDQRYYAVQIVAQYEMIYNESSSGMHYFYINVGENDTATIRMIEKLTGMPIGELIDYDEYMDYDNMYYDDMYYFG